MNSKSIDVDRVSRLAQLAFKHDEIAYFFNCDHRDIAPFSTIIEKSWPDDKSFFKKRKSRLVRLMGRKWASQYIPRRLSLKSRLRASIDVCIKHTYGCSTKNLWEKIGYSLDELMENIGSKFQPGMSWENWGEWHIDHIEPRMRFKNRPIRECWDLNNLQPLWAQENRKKGSKWLKLADQKSK